MPAIFEKLWLFSALTYNFSSVQKRELSECKGFDVINISCTIFHVSVTWLNMKMRVAGSGCDSTLQSLGREVLVCQNVHSRRSSKNQSQKHLRFAVDGASRWCGSLEKQTFQEILNCSCFVVPAYSEYFLRSLQDFDGNLKHTQVETLPRKDLSLTGPNIQHIKVFFLSNSWNLCASAGCEVQETPSEDPGRKSGIYPAEINQCEFNSIHLTGIWGGLHGISEEILPLPSLKKDI